MSNNPLKQRIVISVYQVTRHYGGPEEGGWWYDWYEHVESSRRVRPARQESVEKRLHRKHHIQPARKSKRYSVNNTRGDTITMIEKRAGEFASKHRPHYE